MSKKFSAVLQIGGAIASSLPGAFAQVNRGTATISRSIAQLSQQQRQLNTELARMSQAGPPSPARYLAAKRELDVLNAQVDALRRRKKLADQVADARSATIDKAGKLGGAVVGAAVAAAPVGAAIKNTAGFDYQMQLIGNTADMSADQVHKLRQAIIATGKATGQSAESIQKGLGFLIAAGLDDPAQAQKFIGAIGKTATASNADVEDLAKMVFTLNDTLKISPEGMQQAIDSLAQAGKDGNVELKDMARVLPSLGASFAAMKMGGREAAATMGAALQIARKGTDSADKAATNMDNFMSKIISPETRKKAAAMGLDIVKVLEDAQKTGKNPFEEAMLAVTKVTKGGDQKLIGDLFQDTEVQKFIRPMIQNWSKYKEIKANALAADGTVERDFTKMRDTSMQRMTEINNAVDRLSIAIGSLFAGKAGEGAKGLADQIEAVSAWIEQNRELVITGAKVAATLAGVGIAVRAGSMAFSAAGAAWGVAQQAFAAAPAVLSVLTSGLRLAGGAVMFVGRALLMNPIGLAVTAIAGAAYLVYKNWEPLKQFFADLWDGITAKFDAAVNYMSRKIDYLKSLPGRLYDGVFGGSSTPAPSAPVAPAAPVPVPAMASRGNTQYHVTVNQAPGQSPAATAAAVAAKLGGPRALGAQLHD